MTPEIRERGIRAWEARAKHLHAEADRCLVIDVSITDADHYRRAAKKAEAMVAAWRAIKTAAPVKKYGGRDDTLNRTSDIPIKKVA